SLSKAPPSPAVAQETQPRPLLSTAIWGSPCNVAAGLMCATPAGAPARIEVMVTPQALLEASTWRGVADHPCHRVPPTTCRSWPEAVQRPTRSLAGRENPLLPQV